MAGSFGDILGQGQAIKTIRQACLADRLPHGLIFAGPVGVGKATVARALARWLLCENPLDGEGCGSCSSCKLLQAGNHPDFHPVYRQQIRDLKSGPQAAKELGIDVVREFLINPANHRSSLGRGKFFLVQEADLMTTAAQNAMLKTLEEPGGRTLIVLLSDQPLSLLPTIRSRCQTVAFALLDEQTIRRQLEARGTASPVAAEIARFADGSLGLALRWLEDGVVAYARELDNRLTELLSGRLGGDLPQWLRAAAEAYAEKQIERDEQASKDQQTREGLILYLRLMARFFRQMLSRTDNPALLEKSCAAIDAVAASERMVEANVNVPLIFQQLAVKLAKLFA